MSCIGCKNFYYRSDGSGSCDMPYKDACLNNNFQFYQLSSGFFSKEEAERYFRQKFLCGLRAKASFLDDYLIEDKNILDIFLHENLEGTPPPPLF